MLEALANGCFFLNPKVRIFPLSQSTPCFLSRSCRSQWPRKLPVMICGHKLRNCKNFLAFLIVRHLDICVTIASNVLRPVNIFFYLICSSKIRKNVLFLRFSRERKLAGKLPLVLS